MNFIVPLSHVNRFKLSTIHGIGKIYQIKGHYQKAIDLYIGGSKFKELAAFITGERHLEDLSEAYKCAKFLNDEDQCSKIYNLIKNHFIYIFSIKKSFDLGFKRKHNEVAREPSLLALLIRNNVFNDII